MRKSALYIATALLLATSCNEELMVSQKMGSISLSLSSDREVVVETKAGIDCSDFLVDIYGETFLGDSYASEQFMFSEITAPVEIPFGSYFVNAQSCLESTAETANEGLGTVRYWGVSRQFDVLSYETKEISVSCKMVNGKVTLTLDESYLADFKDPYAELTIGDRTVKLTGAQANGESPVYFNVPEEGADLIYKVYGTVGQGTTQQKLQMYSNASSPLKLQPAKWAKITIKSNHNGLLGPDIIVDGTLYDSSFTEILNPDGGIEVQYSNLPVTLKVDATIDDATVVDCFIDVL